MSHVDPPAEDPTSQAAPDAASNAVSAPTGARRRARSARRVGPRRAGFFSRHPVLTVITTTLLLIAVLTSTTVTLLFHQIDGKITVLTPRYAAPLPDKVYIDAPHQPLNILIMGSDSRDCDGCKIDNQSGGGSDTTILLHLSSDRKHAYGVSIPRDTMVDRPECETMAGDRIPAQTYAQWNAAYSVAGPGCTIEQFGAVTGLHIDDFVVVNFGGFKDMVDAVGGVQVCIPETIEDTTAHITLQAGTRVISGNEALSYVREREGVGDGSDLGRIKRQQAFVASMVHAVLSAQTLSNPIKVYKFLKAATGALQVDSGLGNLRELAKLGYGFRGIGLDNIKFFTAPIAADPQNPTARVVLAPEASRLWKLLAKDKTLPPSLTSSAIKVGNVPGQKKHHHKKTPDSTTQDAALQQAGLCT